jgi:hypothetical protein
VTIFDLVFIAIFLATVVAWLSAGAAALTSAGRRALRILHVWAIGFAAYMAVVIAASLPGSRRVLGPRDPLCFDDWCLALENATRAETAGGATYDVNLRIFSRARRVSQRERNGAVYLEDGRGRRYAPRPDPSAVPLDTRLDPGQCVVIQRLFDLPAGAPAAGLVFRHEGGFPVGWFIVGYETWFRQPTLIRLK